MDGVTGWLAAILTVLAGMTVAANLGTRVTGWGFVLFTIGSLCWALNAGLNGVTSLLLTNLAMAAINAFGVWRWLGRRRRIELGSQAAMEHSAAAPVPTLVSVAAVLDAPLMTAANQAFGSVVDLMLRCERQDLAYAVVSFDGVGGIGEEFRAVPAQDLRLSHAALRATLAEPAIRALPPINPTDWPTVPSVATAAGNRDLP
jgi:hypothetical protein